MSKWTNLKRDLFRSHPLCRMCMIRPAVHLHHGVINKAKVRNRSLHKYLDVRENAIEICEQCHKYADSFHQRVKAYRINADRYGKEHMKAWYDSLPLKVKERMG
jgi:tRNA U54 and U55 pseudouridine synthase Pus10